jgi:hypothetical protein
MLYQAEHSYFHVRTKWGQEQRLKANFLQHLCRSYFLLNTAKKIGGAMLEDSRKQFRDIDPSGKDQ